MSNYYDYREVKVMIAHKLMSMDGWKVYGYKEDRSDSMTDYYDPANWDGVAEKNGYVLCVDVYGAAEQNVTIAETLAEQVEENQTESTQETAENQKKESVSYTVTEDIHTQTGGRIWIVKPETKLNKADFAEVKRKLATMQGYYSTFKHGFVFKYDPTEILQTG